MGAMTLEMLAEDIGKRMTAIDQKMVSEERVLAMIKEQFGSLANDKDFVRKMRFGGDPDKRLFNTKFSRWNLDMGDVEFLYDLMHAERERGKRGPSEELENTFKAYSDAVYIPQEQIRAMDRSAIDNLFPRIHAGNREQYERAIRAMDTAESGYGSQLVGVQYVADLWQAARNEARVANLIGSFEMTAPTAYLPVEVDFPSMTFVSEKTASDATYATPYATVKTGSQRVEVDAKKLVIRQMWSGEMEEDSLIPYIPFLRRQQQISVAFHMDSLALNGDITVATGVNDSNLTVGATHHTGAFDGIRKAGLVDNTGNSSSAANAPISLSLMRKIYGRCIDATYQHDWGHPNNRDNFVHIVDPYTGDAMMEIDELMTKDKAGNDATVFNGQVTRVYGHPVIGSIALRKTDTAGYMDTGATGNELYGSMVSFNVNACKWGWRRRIQVETGRIIERDQTQIISSLRLGFGRFTPTGAASGIEWADVLYYLAV
jgi:hypothetical protein